MAKIKNVATQYVKRAQLSSPKTGEDGKSRPIPQSSQRAKEFLTAPIDDSFYMNFGVLSAKKG